MYIKYLWYVMKHKWYVFIECCKLGIVWRGLVHDLHKFLPCEFIPYAKYFYGNKKRRNKKGNYASPPTGESLFDYAWNHHQKHPLGNHHWQYYVLINDQDGTYALEMPIRNVWEMYADWVGAGRAITGKDNTPEWYAENKHNMMLHKNTRDRIEFIIREADENLFNHY